MERAARGQTGIDFLVGIGVFLLTVGFVVAFIPQLTAPFDASETTLVADRAADTLVGDLLAGPAPSVLDEGCTLAFFGAGPDGDCPFDSSETTGDGLPATLGLSAADGAYSTAYRVNVTLERAGTDGTRSVLCSDWGVGPCGPGTDELAVGPVPPSGGSESVVVATRVVSVSDRDALVVVRVW